MRTLVMLLRLVAFAAVLAAVGAIGVVALSESAEPARQVREADRVAVAEQAAASVSAILSEAFSQANDIGAALQPWSGRPAEAASAGGDLNRLAAAASLLDIGVFVADPSGLVVAASSNQAALIGQVRDGSHVRQATAGTAAISDVIEDPLTHDLLLGVAIPLRDEGGTVTGVLAGGSRIPRGPLVARLSALPAPRGAALVVVTAGRHVLGGPTSTLQRAGTDLSVPLERAGHGSGFVEFEGEGRVSTVAGVAPARDGWVAVVSEPAESFRSTLKAPIRTGVVTITGMLSFCLVALLVLDRSRRVARRRADDAKRALLSIAGHELRTPLTVIKGFTSTLLLRWDDLTDEARRDFVETVDRQSRNLEHLIERLLVGARLDAGIDSPPSSEPLDVAPLLERAAEHHSRLSPLHQVDVTTTRPLTALAEPRALEQVLTHLLENAIKYSPSGGTVHLIGRRAGRRVEIVVEDEGVGLPADRDSIFDKFVQAEEVDTRTHDEGGMGLGLYIVRTHVSQMGGAVTAESRHPRGSRFVVSLRGARVTSELVRSGHGLRFENDTSGL